MEDSRQQGLNIGRGVLQAIFAVFLGLMITAVVGVGVYTFYPNPADDAQEQISDLYEEQGAVEACPPGVASPCGQSYQLSPEQRAHVAELDDQIKELEESAQSQREAWGQTTSIILIVVATGLMAVSLLLGESVAVLSNGILLGGLFTMLYGVGWGLFAGNSVTRFLVLVVALVVSLGLGYLKFVRGRREPEGVGAQPAATSPTWSAPPPAEVADLAARISDLERRLAAAAAGLGPANAGRTTGRDDS